MEPQALFSGRLLTKDSPRAPEPPSFRGKLYPSQAAVLYRMMLLEREQCIPICEDTGETEVLIFNAGSLTTPFASGKTVVITALIAAEKPPRRSAPRLNLPGDGCTSRDISTVEGSSGSGSRGRPGSRRSRSARDNFGSSQAPFATFEWIPDRVIQSTLVVAANSVLSHWEATIREFAPHLTYFTVDSTERLREYVRLVQAGAHSNFHLVLLKMGPMAFATEQAKKNSSLTALCHCLPGFVWDRLVIDDYDTIPIPRSAQLPPAFFTWYVSATRRSSLSAVSLPECPDGELTPETLESMLGQILPGGWPTVVSVRDSLLVTNLRVNCTEEFQNANFVLPAPTITDYRFARPVSLQLLNGIDLSPEAQEALNAGAVHTAAELLGFHCRTPAELAARVLSKHKDAFTKATSELAALSAAEAELRRRQLFKEICATHVSQILTAIRSKAYTGARSEKLDAWVPPEYGYGPRFETDTLAFREKRKELIETSGRALERLRENAQEGECQVCLLPWDEVGGDPDFVPKSGGGGVPKARTYIMNCCQTLLCPVCVTTRGPGGQKQFVKECPNCFQPLFRKGKCAILAMDADINIADCSVGAPASDGTDDPPSAEQQAAPQTTAPTPEEAVDGAWKKFGRDAKIRALLQLIEGLDVTAKSRAPGTQIPGLIGNNGPTIAGAPGESLRFLLFSQHPESTTRIVEALDHCGIPNGILKGHRSKKDKAIHRFRFSTAAREVLIITGSEDCSGIHLPECTDQIYFHKMLTEEVSAQLAGRAQRYGRRASLRVHNLLYEDE